MLIPISIPISIFVFRRLFITHILSRPFLEARLCQTGMSVESSPSRVGGWYGWEEGRREGKKERKKEGKKAELCLKGEESSVLCPSYGGDGPIGDRR
jgi:hypothetical protein